ncbi:MAG TPA: signal peptidase I [Clostridia bacterium]|nr:signal peptidase I [Clostridia bacterium]
MENVSSTKLVSNKIMTAVGIILCIVLIPMLIINLTLIVKSFVYPDKAPSFLGYKPFIVLSGSMQPEFYAGDIALVKEVDVNTLKAQDIIAFKKDGSVITHRIMEIAKLDGIHKFVTKGDSNNVDDGIGVTDEMVEGKYLFHISKIGNTAMFMQTPIGLMIFVALPLMLFILYDILRRQIFDNKHRKETMELEAEIERLRQVADKDEEPPQV